MIKWKIQLWGIVVLDFTVLSKRTIILYVPSMSMTVFLDFFFFFLKLKFCVANYLCKSLWGTWFGSQVSPCADLLALSSCMHCDSLRLLGFHRVTFQNLLQNPFICSGFSPLKHRKNFWRFSSGIWIYLCLPELGPVLSSFYLALMLDVISLQVNVGQFYSDFFFIRGNWLLVARVSLQ